MSSSTAYDKSKGKEEHILELPGGRLLAYAHNGPETARIVVIFFVGLFAVGSVPDVPAPCRDLGVHWISPTLPGMGNSSIRDPADDYHVALSRDMTALLDHLYPTGAFDAIYIAGGSYGTVQAQMLYGAPYHLFPAGRKIAGCFLTAGFAPLKYHSDYAKTLSWQTWFSVGPPSMLPFRPLQHLFKAALASKFKTVDGASGFLQQSMFDKMDDEEKPVFRQWLEKKGVTEAEFVEDMAKGVVRCCQRWDGFMEVSTVVHSDWGFEPATLDDEHATKPLLVIGSEHDAIGGGNNEWIMANYRSAHLKVVPGGHLSSLYHMDDIWREVIDRSRAAGLQK